MIIKIQSLFYIVYRASSSTTRFFIHRVTPLGILVLLLLLAALVVFITYYKLATLHLVSLLCGVLIFSGITVFFKFAKLEINRQLPTSASVGQEVSYVVTCRNLGSKKLRSILIHDASVDPRPTRDEFIHSREPQENLRNGFDRLFAYYRWMWLCKKKTMFDSEPVLLPDLDPSQERGVVMTFKPNRRGRLDFGEARSYIPDPLYLFQKCIRIKSSLDSMIILPRRYRLPELMHEGTPRDHAGGFSYSSMSGVSDDFRGLRPYRPGDPLKHIDWPAWAKTGNPVIREYENVFFPRYALVLDTNGSYENLDAFEEAISIAASFAKVIDTHECLLDLIFLNKGLQTLTVGKGVAKSEDLLEQLAVLEIEMKPDWDSLSQQVLKHSSSFSLCIVIFTQLSGERIKLVREWQKAGLNLLILVLVSDDDEKQAVLEIGVAPIRVSHVQRDLLNSL
jgi:uncharacterized protein (DUF58 family)